MTERSARFAVPEMDCPSCAKKIDRRLSQVEGIESVDLRPATGSITVSYDDGRTSRENIVEAIEGAGYEVYEETSAGFEVDGDAGTGGTADRGVTDRRDADAGIAPPIAVWRSPRAATTWAGGILLVFGLILEFVVPGSNASFAIGYGYDLDVASTLFLGAIATSGAPVVRSAFSSARHRSLDIDLLMGFAIIAATGIGFYLEAATLAVLYSVAELLETYAMDRARNSLRELLSLASDEATVLRNGEEVVVPVGAVEVGDRVVVRPGEKIPVDGIVREGGGVIDESPITGESLPVDVMPGDEVYAGSIDRDGYVEIEVTAPASESTISRIIELVRDAQDKKTKREQFVDRFAGYYTPAIVALAILTATIPPIVFAAPWMVWFVRGLTLLVIACPCAFVISTPVSVVSGITSAAKNGVLVKGGNHLEAMGDVDVIAFDKTGTITSGELEVTDVVPVGAYEENDVLRIASVLERRSEHPIADAILERALEGDLDPDGQPTDFSVLSGRGVTADIDGEKHYVGTPTLFEELGHDLSHAHPRTDGGVIVAGSAECNRTDCMDLRTDLVGTLEDTGKTVVVVGTQSTIVGLIAIADTVRPEAEATVRELRQLGIRHVTLLTGDNEGAARSVASTVGIDDYRATLLPEDKCTAIEALQSTYGTVAMVGDGINDAPALATADVGIAMGAAGTDTALETADIALMADDLEKLPYLYDLSNAANRVIRENIWSSLAVKAILAIGVPLGYVSIALAVVVGDMGMSLGVTGNAMRLSRKKP